MTDYEQPQEAHENQFSTRDLIKKPIFKERKFIIFASILVVFLIVLFGGIFGFGHMVNSKKAEALATMIFPPTQVSAKAAEEQKWPVYIESVGTTAAINGVNVTSQLSGKVTKINFKSGQMVKEGDLLFKMDTKQLEAQLKQDKASLELKKITYDRDYELYQKNATSKQELDQSYAAYQEAIGIVEATQAQIDYMHVYAPFSGEIGIRQINLGEYFQAGNNAASLNQIDPIYINFNITENDISKVKLDQEVQVFTNSFPGKTYTGKVTAIDSRFSDKTLGLEVQATIQNSDKNAQLLPGMFAEVHLMLHKDKNVIVVPQSAITYTLYGNSVFILTPDMKDGKPVKGQYTSFKGGQASIVTMKEDQYTAKSVTIREGEIRGNDVIIINGVKPGDLVATSGQLKLKNGAKAVVNNQVKLDQKDYEASEEATGIND
ncbi:efflux RND transporter periplasmic adaptor subunit [Thiotrichales bacterium 19S9-12]|nr:efflux RND transporter periplasmic adaptor subunit [Thiotrichales bacterium 19S9-11]MCF6811822.1 efflux RND transporter periplasmic adaptor subunit [Thiotrichales bacterium 19S9-12]